MADKRYEENDIKAVADGIRALTGGTSTYKVSEMGSAVGGYWGDFLPVSGSLDESGSIYNGSGYRTGYRLNSAGAEVESSGYVCSGFIPVPAGCHVRISADGIQYLHLYSESHAHLSTQPIASGLSFERIQFRVTGTDAKYTRIAWYGGNSPTDTAKVKVLPA